MTPAEMKSRLLTTYPDAEVEVVDLTGTEDHYQVVIQTHGFQGLTRVQAHQAVMAVFSSELKSGEVHALTIRTVLKETKNV